jgi:hypothetical protein
LGKTEPDKQDLFGCDGYSKTLTTFRPSSLDHEPAVLGGHAYAKAVGSLPGDIAGLECSFHLYRLLKRDYNFSAKGKCRT